jgi:hypothetical protein
MYYLGEVLGLVCGPAEVVACLCEVEEEVVDEGKGFNGEGLIVAMTVKALPETPVTSLQQLRTHPHENAPKQKILLAYETTK